LRDRLITDTLDAMATFHSCVISDADGGTVGSGIRIALEDEAHPGGAPWYGTITATDETELVAGRIYRIVLDDGRSGTFRVRRNTFAGDVNRAVAADGIEPLLSR
jgi:hypothetical protein